MRRGGSGRLGPIRLSRGRALPAGFADPEERGAALGHVERERQADDIAVEGNRAVEVADGEVGLEEALDWDGFVHAAVAVSQMRERVVEGVECVLAGDD